MNSLLLDRSTWDLLLDAKRNIAVASDPYATAQNVACALRLFSGELWYDISKGIPYFEQVLGEAPPINTIKQFFVAAAQAVPDVATAQCFIDGISGRTLTGQVQVRNASGALSVIGIGAQDIIPVA